MKNELVELKIVENILFNFNHSNAITSILRRVCGSTYKFAFDDECWKDTFNQICVNCGTSHAILSIISPNLVTPSKKFVYDQNSNFKKCQDDTLINWINNFEIRENTYKFVEGLPKKVERYFKQSNNMYIFNYTSTLKINVLMCFNNDDLENRVRYVDLIIRNTLNSINNLILEYLTPILGKDRIKKGSLRHNQLQKFLTPHKSAIFMFIDIRNFTPLTEYLRTKSEFTLNTKQGKIKYPSIDELLNQYFQMVCNDVFKFGRIDKFIGDGVMAIFGDISDMDPDAWKYLSVKAICTAIKISFDFDQLRKEWEKNWLCHHQREMPEEIAPKLGIGIHFGPASFGFYGSESYKEFTAIGDTVNVAQRIESQAGKDGLPSILISQPVHFMFKDAENEFGGELIDHDKIIKYYVNLKGKSMKYPVWGIDGLLKKLCYINRTTTDCELCWFSDKYCK